LLPKASVQGTGEAVSVELPRGVQGFKAGEKLGVVAHGSDALLLIREGLSAGPYFAGDLASMSMPEVFGNILSAIRSGKLVVTTQRGRKVVTFRDGQLIFATSTESHERLGKALVRRRHITAHQLEAALEQVKPGRKIGQVLTQMKVLSASALYAAMTDLVKEIVLSLFEPAEGHFIFFEGKIVADDSLKLPERTRDIVLEGMKRGEEAALLRQRLPFTTRVRLVSGKHVPAALQQLVDAAARGASLSELRREVDGSDHAFLKAIEGLLTAGVLQKQATVPTEETSAEAGQGQSPLELYAALIRTICSALTRAGNDLGDLRSFFDDPLPGLEEAFKGVTLDEQGGLDVNQVLKNITGHPALAKAKAYEALDAFVSYALFSAKNVLPADLAATLNREFKHLKEGVAE
jgi:hypothetical protein